MPKVSVVIPLYNKAAHIKRALDSVLAQTEQDFEIIVIDDGSADGGGEIVKIYADSRIRYTWQENAGVSVARNNGIKQAQSDLISFLDADDEYGPKFIATILALRRKHPQAGIYSTGYCSIESNGRKMRPKYRAIPQFPWEGILPNYFEASLGPPPVCSSATSVPKAIFEVVGFFPVGESLGEDLDMWFRIALKYPVTFSSYEGAIYHKGAENRSCNTNKAADGFINTMLTALANNAVPENSIQYVKGMIDKQLVLTASHRVVAGDSIAARRYLCETKGNFFDEERKYWLFWSYIPRPLFKMILWLKLNILNEFYYMVKPKNYSL